MLVSKRTIAKIRSFVIFTAGLATLACGNLSSGSRRWTPTEQNPNYGPPRIIGRITAKDIPESSGIAVSACQNDVMWTHNDSGDDAYIFAIDMTGKLLATYRVENAKNKDWEDIAGFKDGAGKCYIYLGEIGDNDLKREQHSVYRIPEPSVPRDGAATERSNAIPTSPAEVVNYAYPDRDHNAETLMVHPKSGEIYVLSKEKSSPSMVFKIKPTFNATEIQTAEKIGEIAVPSVPNGFLTGGDIAPDGKHVIICDYVLGYELTLPGETGNFDDIWKQTPVVVDLGKRKDGEAVTYNVDGSALIATCEGVGEPIIQIDRKK